MIFNDLSYLKNILISILSEAVMNILKLFHVFFLFSWIGSLLVLTRICRDQAKEPRSVQESFLPFLRKIYLRGDLPMMIAALITGIALLMIVPFEWKAGWFHMKLMFAVFLIACDIFTGIMIYKLSLAPISHVGIWFRWIHVLVALFLFLILFSIYGIRDKEKEIITRYQARQAILEALHSR